MKNKSYIFLYDFLLVKGGAESLTLTLCDAIPNLDLGVAFVDEKNFPESPISVSRIKLFSSFTKILGWQTIKSTYHFENNTAMIAAYDKVIFSGSSAPLAVNNREVGGNILYCHTPPRFIYDLKEYYLAEFPWWKGLLVRLLIALIQPKFERSIQKMDLIVANSKNVQARIKKYLNRESIVVYPPCHIDKYKWHSQGDYYLSTARVEPFKRIKLIVQAFIKMPDKKLIVASGGSQVEELILLAQGYKNVSFTGWCEEQQLLDLVGGCIATIYLPIDEDFGISPVESMAAGKPVIGVNEGGVLETVLDNITGVLCPKDPTANDIFEAVNKLTASFSLSLKENCLEQSKQFSADIFVEKMKKLLECDNNDLFLVGKEVDASS